MLDVLFVGFISACFTNFFDDMIQDGMILEKYGKFIDNKPIFKPLGGCLICTNVWVAVLMILLFNFVPILFNILAIFGIANTALKFIIK